MENKPLQILYHNHQVDTKYNQAAEDILPEVKEAIHPKEDTEKAALIMVLIKVVVVVISIVEEEKEVMMDMEVKEREATNGIEITVTMIHTIKRKSIKRMRGEVPPGIININTHLYNYSRLRFPVTFVGLSSGLISLLIIVTFFFAFFSISDFTLFTKCC